MTLTDFIKKLQALEIEYGSLPVRLADRNVTLITVETTEYEPIECYPSPSERNVTLITVETTEYEPIHGGKFIKIGDDTP